MFFEDMLDLDLFFNKLSAMFKTKLHPRESLIFFDEVQRFPRAREMIKFFVEDGRYDFIEAGSLISIKQNIENIVIPSEEQSIDMYPMDFEEFLWAMGDEVTVPFLKTCFEKLMPLGQALHRKVLNDFRQYMLVGGMPQAVIKYIETKDFAKTDFAKKAILRLYRADVTRFAGENKARVLAIYDEIPAQLSKQEKKFRLAALDKEARMRTYEASFIWLTEAMITNVAYNANDPTTTAIEMYKDSASQKCYFADTGLLVTLAFAAKSYINNELYKAVLLDKLSVNEGMLMENIVAAALRFNGHKLYFYSRADHKERENDMEIDFLVERGRKICPIEVKSSDYASHTSLDKLIEKFKGKIGQAYLLYDKDIMVKDGIVHLPLYMAMFL